MELIEQSWNGMWNDMYNVWSAMTRHDLLTSCKQHTRTFCSLYILLTGSSMPCSLIHSYLLDSESQVCGTALWTVTQDLASSYSALQHWRAFTFCQRWCFLWKSSLHAQESVRLMQLWNEWQWQVWCSLIEVARYTTECMMENFQGGKLL